MIRKVVPGVVSWTVFLLVSTLNFVVGLTLQLAVLPFDRVRRTCLWVDHYFWGRLLWWAAPFWHLHVTGAERVGTGPVILVANHQSVLDIPATMNLPLPLRVLARPELFRVPGMGTYMRISRQIAVDPATVGATLDTCRANLAAGVSLLIFPEGTRTEDGTLGSFHKGAFRIAKDTGARVIPLAIRGTESIMSKGALWTTRFRVDVQVRVLEPLDPDDFGSAKVLAARAREQIAAELETMGWMA